MFRDLFDRTLQKSKNNPSSSRGYHKRAVILHDRKINKILLPPPTSCRWYNLTLKKVVSQETKMAFLLIKPLQRLKQSGRRLRAHVNRLNVLSSTASVWRTDAHAVQSVLVLVAKTNLRIRTAMSYSFEHSKKLKTYSWPNQFSADAKNPNAVKATVTAFKQVSRVRRNAAVMNVQTKRAAHTHTKIWSLINTFQSSILIIWHLKTKLGPKNMRLVTTRTYSPRIMTAKRGILWKSSKAKDWLAKLKP